jgi:hypothetical protein
MTSLVRYLIVAMAIFFASCDQKETQDHRSGAVSQNASGDAGANTGDISSANWTMADVEESYLIIGGLKEFDSEVIILDQPTISYQESAHQASTTGVAEVPLREKDLALVKAQTGKTNLLGLYQIKGSNTKFAIVRADEKKVEFISGDPMYFNTPGSSKGLSLAASKGSVAVETLSFSCGKSGCSGIEGFLRNAGGRRPIFGGGGRPPNGVQPCPRRCTPVPRPEPPPIPPTSPTPPTGGPDVGIPDIGNKCAPPTIDCGPNGTGGQLCCGPSNNCVLTGRIPPLDCKPPAPPENRCNAPGFIPCGPTPAGYRWCCSDDKSCGDSPAKACVEPPDLGTPVPPPTPDQICGQGTWANQPIQCGTALNELKCCAVNQTCKTDFPGPRCEDTEGNPPTPPVSIPSGGPTPTPIDPFQCRDRNRQVYCGPEPRAASFTCCSDEETCTTTSLGLYKCEPKPVPSDTVTPPVATESSEVQ